MSKFRERKDERIGTWTVLSRAKNLSRRVMWNIKCDCGTELTVRGEYLDKLTTCQKCYAKTAPTPKMAFKKNDPRITGESHYLWKGGKPSCQKCNKKLSIYSATLCKSCSMSMFPRRLKGWITKTVGYSKDYLAKWRQENPERVQVANNKRRKYLLNSETNFSGNEWIELKEFFQNKCLDCGSNQKKLTVDHVVPLSLGGDNSIRNIQPLCKSCNSKKGIKVIDFRNIYV